MDMNSFVSKGRALLPIFSLVVSKGRFAEAEKDFDTLLAYASYFPAFTSKDTAFKAIKQLITSGEARPFKEALSNVVNLVIELADTPEDADKVLLAFEHVLGLA